MLVSAQCGLTAEIHHHCLFREQIRTRLGHFVGELEKKKAKGENPLKAIDAYL